MALWGKTEFLKVLVPQPLLLSGVGIHSSPGQPVPVSHPSHSTESLPHVQSKLTLSQFKTVTPNPVSGKKLLFIILINTLLVLKGHS